MGRDRGERHKRELLKRLLDPSVKKGAPDPEADREGPLRLEGWPEEPRRTQTVHRGGRIMGKTVQEMMEQMYRCEREQRQMDTMVTNKAVAAFRRMAQEVHAQSPEAANRFDQLADGMSLINFAAEYKFNSHGGDQTIERGLGKLEGMWQFLDGESPELGKTNYQWLVSKLPEAADDLDAGLDELDKFTGIEEEARQKRKNPYVQEIETQQGELDRVLHGQGEDLGLLYYSNPENDYDEEFLEEHRETAHEKCCDTLAAVLAAHSMSLDPNHAHDRRVKPGALEPIASTFQRSSAFKYMTTGYEPAKVEKLCQDPEGTMKRFGTVQRGVSQVQRRSRGLAEQLKATTQKSFAGRMKSWFVGNSKQYKNALESIEAVANGTGDVLKAIGSVKAYLSIRRDKVRDHEYGRERFDGMMKFLQTTLTPKEFRAYCNEVNASRRKLNPNSRDMVHPEDYYPERSAQQLLTAQAQLAGKEGYTPTLRETARLVAAMELGQGDQQRPLNAKALRERTDALVRTNRFKQWFETRQPDDIKRMMTQNPAEMSNYDATLTREQEKREREFHEFKERGGQGEGPDKTGPEEKPVEQKPKGPEPT